MHFFQGLLGRAWNLAKAHWTSIAAIAVSALVFTAIVWLAPVSIPALVTMGVAGFVSGAIGSIVGDLLDRKKPTVKSVLIAATISAILSVGSAGIARWVKPHLPKLWKPISNWVLRPTLSLIGRPGVTVATRTVVEVGEPIVASAIRTFGRSVGYFGSEIFRSNDDRKPEGAQGSPPPARGPPTNPTAESDPSGTNDPPATTARAPSSSAGLVGALSNPHR
ncbi:MAG: hypothetical protein ACAI25_03725 [Planctomycetota bacterium]